MKKIKPQDNASNITNLNLRSPGVNKQAQQAQSHKAKQIQQSKKTNQEIK